MNFHRNCTRLDWRGWQQLQQITSDPETNLFSEFNCFLRAPFSTTMHEHPIKSFHETSARSRAVRSVTTIYPQHCFSPQTLLRTLADAPEEANSTEQIASASPLATESPLAELWQGLHSLGTSMKCLCDSSVVKQLRPHTAHLTASAARTPAVKVTASPQPASPRWLTGQVTAYRQPASPELSQQELLQHPRTKNLPWVTLREEAQAQACEHTTSQGDTRDPSLQPSPSEMETTQRNSYRLNQPRDTTSGGEEILYV